MNDIVLHVADVHKSFGGLRALSNIDLQIEQGNTHAIIGPNGAGKSTLLNVCVGRIVPDAGAVIFDGATLTGRQPHEINQLGVARVFQTPEIFSDLSLLHNVMIPAFAKRDGAFTLNAWSGLAREDGLRAEAESVLKDIGRSSTRRIRRRRACRAATSVGWNWPWGSSSIRGFFCSTSRRPACRVTIPTARSIFSRRSRSGA